MSTTRFGRPSASRQALHYSTVVHNQQPLCLCTKTERQYQSICGLQSIVKQYCLYLDHQPPAISADGHVIAFDSTASNGATTVHVLNLLTNSTVVAGSTAPHFTPSLRRTETSWPLSQRMYFPALFQFILPAVSSFPTC